MCNFSESIRDKAMAEGRNEGIAEGKIEGKNIGKEETTIMLIRNLMEEAIISIHKAMELLRVPMSERDRYTVLIQS